MLRSNPSPTLPLTRRRAPLHQPEPDQVVALLHAAAAEDPLAALGLGLAAVTGALARPRLSPKPADLKGARHLHRQQVAHGRRGHHDDAPVPSQHA